MKIETRLNIGNTIYRVENKKAVSDELPDIVFTNKKEAEKKMKELNK